MSFFKNLFGSKSKPSREPRSESHKGFTIKSTPVREGDQWRLCGEIVEPESGESRQYIRADLFASFDQAEEFTLNKGRQIINEQGERLFSDKRSTRL